jgi:hypothetical protein
MFTALAETMLKLNFALLNLAATHGLVVIKYAVALALPLLMQMM